MEERHCVLTGDLIGSSRAKPQDIEHAFKTLEQGFTYFERWWQRDEKARFTRFRGDGWHGLLTDPQRALRATVFLLASLRASGNPLRTRISIGIGTVLSIGTNGLADARGDAFLFSGRALDEMARGRVIAATGDGITPLHQVIVQLIGERSLRWSREQAEAVAHAYDSTVFRQSEIADRLGITVQAVNARLTSAGFQAIKDATEIWARPDAATEIAKAAK